MREWDLSFELATGEDAEAIADLCTAAADQLTAKYGRGHWSWAVTSRSVSRNIRTCTVLVARDGSSLLGTLTLTKKKPWAIDPAYYNSVARPLYLISMAVDPRSQGSGVGRQLVETAKDTARNLQFDAIRLDAYDAPAGAGGFYLKCGFREVGRVIYRNTPLIYFEFLIKPGA